MHELSIVFHIIKSVNEIAVENNVKRISSVTLEIGEVSTAIPYMVEDCWNWAVKKETVLKDAKLIIEPIKAVTFCEDCKTEYETVAHGKICPNCGSPHTFLVTGNEINIKQIEAIDDENTE